MWLNVYTYWYTPNGTKIQVNHGHLRKNGSIPALVLHLQMATIQNFHSLHQQKCTVLWYRRPLDSKEMRQVLHAKGTHLITESIELIDIAGKLIFKIVCRHIFFSKLDKKSLHKWPSDSVQHLSSARCYNPNNFSLRQAHVLCSSLQEDCAMIYKLYCYYHALGHEIIR